MLTRRSFLNLTGAVAALALVPGLRAFAQSAADRASAFVKNTGERLVAVVNGPGSMQEKRQRLQQVIDSAVDVDGVARFCLGRYWRSATSEQQKQYIALFHDVLLNNIGGKLGEYQGVKFTVLRAQDREDNQVVSTVVERPNNPPTNVDWIISEASGSPKIVDVVAEGTSLRLTQRSDYAAYLARNNNSVQSLIDAMRQQVAQSG
jgi:phospholipid transport system substrate-binding protein